MKKKRMSLMRITSSLIAKIKSNFVNLLKEGEEEQEKIETCEENEEESEVSLQVESLVGKYKKIISSSSQRINRGREKEVKSIFDVLEKKSRHHLLIVGEYGVGKNCVVEAIAETIARRECPKSFFDRNFVKINVEELNPGIYSMDEVTAKIIALAKYLEENKNTILYMREFNLIFNWGLQEAIKCVIERCTVIATADTDKLDGNEFKSDRFMLSRFELFQVESPEYEKCYEMIRTKVQELAKYHGIRIKRSDVELIIDLVYKRFLDVIPGDVMEAVDSIMAIAKNHGMHRVDTKAILELERPQIDDFLQLPEKKVEEIAYHESGHCIVGIAVGHETNGMQIIPIEERMGSTYFVVKNTPNSRTELINQICILIAGNLATKKQGFEVFEGISDDIERATKIARDMVLKYSMEEEFLQSYADEGRIETSYLSEKIKYDADIQVKRILIEAVQKTKAILEEKAHDVETLTHALIRKGFLTQKEIEQLLDGRLKVEEIPKLKNLIF